jgi:glyceraldehyde 3-phosphate dehydrogenase
LINRDDVQIAAINDLTDNTVLAHLLKYDSSQGKFDGTIACTDDTMTVNGKEIKTFAERDPSKLPWKELKIDLVLECTGVFVTKEKASLHLQAGAKDVLLSAPAKGEGVQTIVLGVNDHELDRRHNVFSNASCTTNCLAPILKVVHENWDIQAGFMTTVHAYTADQQLQDAPHKDLRRARAGAFNIVPTTTGAAKAAAIVYPPVKDKLSAVAIRVPVITGSLIELDVVVNRVPKSIELVNQVFKAESEGRLKGILAYTEDPIVSSDIVRDPHSSIFDSLMTDVNQNLIKVVSWYDNEAGYSARLADLACKLLRLD